MNLINDPLSFNIKVQKLPSGKLYNSRKQKGAQCKRVAKSDHRRDSKRATEKHNSDRRKQQKLKKQADTRQKLQPSSENKPRTG